MKQTWPLPRACLFIKEERVSLLERRPSRGFLEKHLYVPGKAETYQHRTPGGVVIEIYETRRR